MGEYPGEWLEWRNWYTRLTMTNMIGEGLTALSVILTVKNRVLSSNGW
jgi:hypothetical protein